MIATKVVNKKVKLTFFSIHFQLFSPLFVESSIQKTFSNSTLQQSFDRQVNSRLFDIKSLDVCFFFIRQVPFRSEIVTNLIQLQKDCLCGVL